MAENAQVAPQENVAQEQPKNDKEFNFSQLKKQLESERQARAQLEREVQEIRASVPKSQEDDDQYDEPYIDKRYLGKRLEKATSNIREESKKEAQQEARRMFEEYKREQWLKSNSDFQEVMQHAQKFAEADPELAETILQMPEGFERQKLVYRNIKALGLHKPPAPKESVQDKVNNNRKPQYYQPSQMGAAPYGNNGDFSEAGQKNAYNHLQALKRRLGVG